MPKCLNAMSWYQQSVRKKEPLLNDWEKEERERLRCMKATNLSQNMENCVLKNWNKKQRIIFP